MMSDPLTRSCNRVFKLKLDALLKELMVEHRLGQPIGFLYVVEFQKRGLPHAHILIILHPDDKPTTPEMYDQIVCAELPNPITEPALFATIKSSMMHGPCGNDNPRCPCMVDGHCKSLYPKDFLDATVETDGYPMYRRREYPDEEGRFVWKTVVGSRTRFKLDNRMVVPYNRALCKRFNVSIDDG